MKETRVTFSRFHNLPLLLLYGERGGGGGGVTINLKNHVSY